MKKTTANGLLSMLVIFIVFLFIQFLLGMYINLFVSIPALSPFIMMGYGPYEGFPIVMAHMFLGILLGFISLGILVISAGFGNGKVLIGSIALFLSVLLAGIDGLFFLFDGQNNVNSYLMATGFILAMLFAILLLIYQPIPQRESKTTFR